MVLFEGERPPALAVETLLSESSSWDGSGKLEVSCVAVA